MRGDDAIGPMIIDALKGKTDAVLMDCGEAPESYLGKIEKIHPEKIIIADAVQMDKPPGTVETIDINEIKGVVMSSHNMPMTLFFEYLQTRVKNELLFIGIQPKSTEFNQPLSGECKKSVDTAVNVILKLINQE